MGMDSILKNRKIIENSYGVLGIEFLAAAQALDFRKFSFGKGTTVAQKEIRKHVTHMEEDRPLCDDHNVMLDLVKSLDILNAVEGAIGPLAE